MTNLSVTSIYSATIVCRTVVVLLTILICGCDGDDAKPKVSKVEIVSTTPASPANLPYGENVQITYNYVVVEEGGARIFVQGLTDGVATSYYSPSPIYTGEGSKTVTITVISAEPSIEVDQLRIRIVNPGQTAVIFETFVDVSFTFSD